MTGAPPPTWAVELVERVCAEAGRRPPLLQWWRREDWTSSGHAAKANGRLHVTAGTSEQDARLVLLHELAHWLRRGTHAHDRRFWEIAWDLFGRYGVDMDWAIFREGTYLKRSLWYCPLTPGLRPPLPPRPGRHQGSCLTLAVAWWPRWTTERA